MKALVRAVSPAMNACELTHLHREPIDIELAKRQHGVYVEKLELCGCQILEARPEPLLPDSIFVEDTAVVLPELAIITHPGAKSRQPECASVAEMLAPYRTLHHMALQYHLDGGDVLIVNKQVFIGWSTRTDKDAIRWIANLLDPYNYQVTAVPLTACLHLKSAITYLGAGRLLYNPAWVDADLFNNYQLIPVHPLEPVGANALRVRDQVIYSSAYPRTAEQLLQKGIDLHLIDNSEVLKAEGAVTCCSIIF